MVGEKIIKAIRSGVPGKVSFSKVIDDIDYLIRVEDVGQYSIVFSELVLTNAALKEPIDFESFENQVQSLEKKLSYFMEHPKLLEIDKNECVAQLRSHPPEKEDGKIKYYEIIFSKGKKINFHRVANQNSINEKINMVIPDHLLTRLLDDFTETLKLYPD